VEVAEPLSGRVLLADADPVARKVLRKMVEQEGLESDGAEDGGQALRMARSGDYAMVLLACELPESDGFETARRIRGFEGKSGSCAVLGMVGEDVPGTRERALRAGMDELLLMPMAQAEFRAVLRRYLAVAARQDAPN
jgi:CheY-like chemotaxis protein